MDHLEEIVRLLDVMDGTRGLPKLKALHDVAELSLVEAAADAQKELDKRKEAEAKKAREDEAWRLAEAEREKEQTDPPANPRPPYRSSSITEPERRA